MTFLELSTMTEWLVQKLSCVRLLFCVLRVHFLHGINSFYGLLVVVPAQFVAICDFECL